MNKEMKSLILFSAVAGAVSLLINFFGQRALKRFVGDKKAVFNVERRANGNVTVGIPGDYGQITLTPGSPDYQKWNHALGNRKRALLKEPAL